MRTAVAFVYDFVDEETVCFVHLGSMGPWLTTVLYDPQLAHWDMRWMDGVACPSSARLPCGPGCGTARRICADSRCTAPRQPSFANPPAAYGERERPWSMHRPRAYHWRLRDLVVKAPVVRAHVKVRLRARRAGEALRCQLLEARPRE